MAYSIRKHPTTLLPLCKITPSNKTIRLPKRNGSYCAFSADAGNAEGENLVAVVLDECHAHRSEKIYRSLEYASVARPDSILVFISTSGQDMTHWYFSVYTKAKRVLSGDDLDHTFFPTIYEIPPEADIEDEPNWILANPSLGVSFSKSAFRKDLKAAKSDTASWLSFQRYRLNRWISGSDQTAFDVLKWDLCKKDMKTAGAICFLGVDLSQSIDPSSITAVWVLPDKHYGSSPKRVHLFGEIFRFRGAWTSKS
jgi:phage terminase large subunit-like protein